MSVVKIRAALEIALASMTPSLATAFENVAFSPPDSSIPFQRIWFMDFLTDNPEMSGNFHQVRSYFQIDLLYPLQAGTSAIAARAELIKSTFKRGASFVKDGVTVTITNTPTVSGGDVDGNMYKVIVKVRYAAQIFS